MLKLFLPLLLLLILSGCSQCKPTEVEKMVYNDRYFYTWFNTEYKIWEWWFIFNKETQSYDKVVICWFVIINNTLEIWEYSYLVSKDSCYDTAKTKNVFKYNFNKELKLD